MVNRVFSYSLTAAENNKIKISIPLMILEIFGLVILMTIAIFVVTFSYDGNGALILTIVMIIWFVILFVYIFNKRAKFQSGLMGFATDNNNNLYCALKLNNGEDFAIGGMALGNVIKNLSPNNESMLGNATQVVGGVLALYSINKSLKIMSNPEVISQMVEYASELSGGEVRKILKVHALQISSKKIKIIYDYQNMNNNKQKYNKKLTIYRVYNSFNDLIQKLEEKR